MEAWTRGAKYKIRYRLPGQRYDREMVGVYLGSPHPQKATGIPRERQFSLRPDFGTQTLSMDWIKSNERVDDDHEMYIDRRAK